MLWFKVAAIGLAIAFVVAAKWQYDETQQAKGAAEIQVKQARRDAEMERKARQAADEIAARQKARAVDSERKLATQQAISRALSDSIAAKDPEYAAWRSTRIPGGAPIRMRDAGDISTPEGRGVPIPVPNGATAKPSR